MQLAVKPATNQDVPAMVDILFRAFADDILLIGTCYPDTCANRQWWTKTMMDQMTHKDQTMVFKVVDETSRDEDGNEKLVAWAKWLVQRRINAAKISGAVNPDIDPSPDMDLEACRSLAEGQYKMRDKVLGDREHYWLNAIATDPDYRRHGAASQLVACGTQYADKDGLECFSACTTQANQNMANILRRAGFEIVAAEPVIYGKGLSVHAGYRKATKS